jgi:hypothetical protein
VVAVATLSMIGAMAALCFVRSPASHCSVSLIAQRNRRESSVWMTGPMLVLGVLVIALAVLPGTMAALDGVADRVLGKPGTHVAASALGLKLGAMNAGLLGIFAIVL